MKKKSKIYGKELILNLRGCDSKILSSRKKVLDYIDKLCQLIEVRKFGKARVARFGQKSSWDLGYSFFQFIEGSSIVGHLVEKDLNLAFINIFSCKPFDEKIAENFTKDFFQAKEIKSQVLVRC